MRDITNNMQRVHLGNVTVSGTTPATSAYVDLQGYNAAEIMVIANTVTDAGTAAGFTVTLQESADTAGASATTVPVGSTVNGANTIVVTDDNADNSVAGAIGYRGGERYLGVTVTGTTGSDADISVIAILGKPHVAPVAVSGTSVART